MRLPETPYADGIGKRGQLQFYGLDHNLGAADGGLWDMRNLTSDYYPLLATRPKRKKTRKLTSGGGLFAWDALAWVDGTGFYYGGAKKGDVTAGEKRFAAIGAYIIILPDKKYYNTVSGAFGSLESTWSGWSLTFTNGKLFEEAAEANTIRCANVRWADYFKPGDAVTISGCTKHTENNKTPVIREIDGDKLYFYENVFKLDGSEGDWMMYEPFYWSKGINDYLNNKKYACYSSYPEDEMPPVPEATILTLDAIKETQGGWLGERKIMSGKPTLMESYTTDKAYSVCKVDVSGYRRVRFPSVPGTGLIGSVFVDDAGNILKSIVVPTIGLKFEAGMYLIADVPERATALHFSILNTAEFDCVVLSNSDKIEDMEPDWVANEEHLCAVVGSSVVGSKLRACITGASTTASMTWTDFHYYSQQRGMQQIDALMHSRIANLSYAKYGRRDMQEQCGAGQHNNNRTTGGTADHGMTDTIGYDEAYVINNKITNSLIDGLVHQYAWYKSRDEYGQATVVQVNNICCLGYEDIYGNKYDMMDGVDLPNDSGNQGKWRIWMPDGSIRMVQGKKDSGQWITGVAHGKYMDMVPVGNLNGSSSTYYTDMYWISTATVRVVYRGCDYANAYGGVSGADAYSDASSANAYVGSRLAFRGKIVRAQSVAAYKAIREVA